MQDDVQDGASPDVPGTLKRVESVQSMARGLAVIKAFNGARPRMTLSEVARQTDLTRATARRFLHTLVTLGYTDTDGREFWLRPKVLELGYAYLSSLSLPDVAAPHLKSLADQVNESASVSVLDGTDIVYVARVPTRRIMAVSISVGTRFPAFATSMGRVLLAALSASEAAELIAASDLKPLTRNTITSAEALLAELDRIRQQGWALVDQELEVGLRSIAVPIRDSHASVVAAMNVSVSVGHDSVEQSEQRLLPPLLAVAGALEHDLAAKLHNGS
ncbi:MAG TPA: IclR family transcriptional regulator C-terminal domain-containing protein [Kineosporiaceae bacterium]|nr:IclR family transcriptional regulator C-terminal domain-containing protein [Kineosporiaceae bacterium]